MQIAINAQMPPTNPTNCFFDNLSLNIIADIIWLNIIVPPLARGKNNWLGNIPASFRFK